MLKFTDQFWAEYLPLWKLQCREWRVGEMRISWLRQAASQALGASQPSGAELTIELGIADLGDFDQASHQK